ncbi:glycosyltransferase family 4 protein [Synechococcus sp. AH-551-A10]|nr:glycosyltransferase family 4 protein [Synechococcus sp. AH-551-A10]
MGRQSAGASFLEAYIKFSGNSNHHIAVPNSETAKWFHQQAQAFNPKAFTHATPLSNWGKAGKINGAFHIPSPMLNEWAWRRMPWGDGAFSLMGIVHTLCTFKVQQGLGQFSSSPIREWDALICTSNPARNAVLGFLERQEDWLSKRYQSNFHAHRPQLPVIPLGIHPDTWEPPINKIEARKRARAKLGIHQEAQIILIAGRLDLLTKFQPAPLFKALQDLREDFPYLELLIYGEAPDEGMLNIWKKGAKQLAPTLPIHWIPGKELDLSGPARWAADVFASLPDNPQETFGITPLEAMAAELPCIVSDWDGYRDSVIQPGEAGEATGFRITTRMIRGLGEDEANKMLQYSINYTHAMGRISQGIAVDINEFKEKLSILLNSNQLRFDMGKAGRTRVENFYDWRVVIEQWRALTDDLYQRRTHAIASQQCTPPQLPPWMPDTSTGFGCFASEIIPASWSPEFPDHHLEVKELANPLQSWDKSLLNSMSSRRRGWWLKNNLVDYN